MEVEKGCLGVKSEIDEKGTSQEEDAAEKQEGEMKENVTHSAARDTSSSSSCELEEGYHKLDSLKGGHMDVSVGDIQPSSCKDEEGQDPMHVVGAVYNGVYRHHCAVLVCKNKLMSKVSV